VRTRFLLPLALALAAGVAAPPGAHAASASRRHRRSVTVNLVWHVESVDGKVVESHEADEPINPASVVKVGTSLWALERLGPQYRFETRFFARGRVNAKAGAIDGDLIVQGSGDPDFQDENAFLVASALNGMGITQVRGAVIVNRRFWIGWENGSAGVNPDPVQRGLLMATRLRQALDPRRWNGALRAAWREFAARRGLDVRHPPRVWVRGGVGMDGERVGELLLVHRSSPLVFALRRFNCYSNNDIERIGADLGPVDELANLLRVRTAAPEGEISLETSSGLGTNRLTPRIVVRLLREFRETCQRTGVSIESVLPVAGCDPGTVDRFFPHLVDGPDATAVVGKTGTLTTTDGGISVLAGIASTVDGDYAFCVAAPKAGGLLHLARRAEEKFVLDLIARHGGPKPHTCGPVLPYPDTEASVIVVKTSESAPPSNSLGAP
jgi:D-alanyl-D-alanine carboxypeptidase/D-alanyl-D-alanine-endopeptidase (penicillin-binding protein 4)